MQTFLPYPNFDETAQALDMKRLGKQRVENLQIMKALLMPDYGWKNHPAVRMWRGYERGLLQYQRAIVSEWVSRGYRDTCMTKTWDVYVEHSTSSRLAPPWLGFDDLHVSHRSNLIRKDPAFYGPKWPDLDGSLPYVWPK